MNIIKSVDLGLQKFECRNCETIFEANADEYSKTKRREFVKHHPIDGNNTKRESSLVWFITSQCPLCRVYISHSIPTGEANIFEIESL
jgi:hypothetical protein